MNSFSNKIKAIEARINRLKTLGLSSSSSLSVAEYPITLSFQIVATRTGSGGEVFDAGASQRAYVKIKTKNSQPALTSIRYIGPLNFGDRILYSNYSLGHIGDNDYGFVFYIYGDSNDIQALQNGQVLPMQNYNYKILSTSEITSISIQYENVEIN